MSFTDLYFASRGRISRKTWWIGVAGLIVWNIIVFFVLWTMFGPSLFLTFVGRLFNFVFNLLNIFLAYNLAVKRFNDRERPIINAQAVAGFWGFKSVTDLFRITGDPWAQNWMDQLILLVGTGIGLWYFIELGCMRGTVGPNAHGEDPVPEAA
jgi:uncharacterized membrane protein YhaH (DUF805 family)